MVSSAENCACGVPAKNVAQKARTASCPSYRSPSGGGVVFSKMTSSVMSDITASTSCRLKASLKCSIVASVSAVVVSIGGSLLTVVVRCAHRDRVITRYARGDRVIGGPRESSLHPMTPSPITPTSDLRPGHRDGEIDQPVSYTRGVCQGDGQSIFLRQTGEMRMTVLDHRHGEQISARGVLHQDKGVGQLERPGEGVDDLRRGQLMGDGTVAKAVQPEFQVLQLQHLAIRDGDQMNGREIRVLGARAKTSELREALVEDLAMSLRSRPDLPGRGIRHCRDRFAAVLPIFHVRHPAPDSRLRSGIVGGDGHLADLLT